MVDFDDDRFISSRRMYVTKRDGRREPVLFDKITARIENLCDIEPRLNPEIVDPVIIAQKVVSGVFPGVETSQLDELAAEEAAAFSAVEPEYGDLAGRIVVSNLQKSTPKKFSEAVDLEYNYVNPKTGEKSPLISEEVYNIVMKNKDLIDGTIKPERDYNFDYFGIKTAKRGYLFALNGKHVETPQYMLMRVSIGIHGEDLESAFRTYDLMSQKYFIHASPTMFNAGTPVPQMSSCFLLTMTEDSIEGIYETLKRCALISKTAGGIGLSTHCIRATNSYIKGTNGASNGLVPMLKVYNDTARYVDQGGGKRKGAFSVYVEPWHADIYEFLDLKKNTGKEESRARDLFYALWIPDLFMRRVKNNEMWSLFCPNEAPGLDDCWGEAFEELYTKYENTKGLVRKSVRAQDLWFTIIESQLDTGTPYMLFKDSCNRKSNHQHLGTIKSANLCCEIVQYTSPEEVAVCNLASICLPMCIVNGEFDHKLLFDIVQTVVPNLDRIIDRNFNPVPQARVSNMKHRPLGMGYQGLADVFLELKLPFTSDPARALSKGISETMYFAGLTASCKLARQYGPYPSYEGSPVSKGILQFDMWGITPSDRWDWDSLRKDIAKYGVRNSLIVALMPTASTSQIMGFNECFEPYTSNLYTRRVLAGDFMVINRELVNDLRKLGLWTRSMKNMITAHGGSIQGIPSIPDHLKEIYKTVWEISQRDLIDMSADRSAFVDQALSDSRFIATPNYDNVSSMHFHAWETGLKVGMYYFRTRPAADAIKFTVDQLMLRHSLGTPENPDYDEASEDVKDKEEDDFCTMKEGCLSCGA